MTSLLVGLKSTAMKPRKLFVAGATGATGQVLLRLADARGLPVVPHLRPRSAASHPALAARGAVLELDDRTRLVEALSGCTTVIQLIGTMRHRFAGGDTYETSDIGTTVQLAAAAREAGLDHLVLLSSVGAGRPFGAYLKAKAKAEAVVRESGLPYTVFRPSALEGGERKSIPGARTLTRMLGLKRFEPIALADLAAALLHVAMARAPLGTALEGDSLWEQVAAATTAQKVT